LRNENSSLSQSDAAEKSISPGQGQEQKFILSPTGQMEAMVVFISTVPGYCYFSWPQGIYLIAGSIFCAEEFDIKRGKCCNVVNQGFFASSDVQKERLVRDAFSL
jgi:hypothetical protein